MFIVRLTVEEVDRMSSHVSTKPKPKVSQTRLSKERKVNQRLHPDHMVNKLDILEMALDETQESNQSSGEVVNQRSSDQEVVEILSAKNKNSERTATHFRDRN